MDENGLESGARQKRQASPSCDPVESDKSWMWCRCLIIPDPDISKFSKYIQMVRSCCRHGWDAETQRRLTLPQNEEEAQYRKDAADGHFHGVVDVSMVPIGRLRPQELLGHISFTFSHPL